MTHIGKKVIESLRIVSVPMQANDDSAPTINIIPIMVWVVATLMDAIPCSVFFGVFHAMFFSVFFKGYYSNLLIIATTRACSARYKSRTLDRLNVAAITDTLPYLIVAFFLNRGERHKTTKTFISKIASPIASTRFCITVAERKPENGFFFTAIATTKPPGGTACAFCTS